MPGMIRLLLLLVSLVLLCSPCAFGQSREEETRINIDRLQESIQEHEDMLVQSADKERSLFAELERLDRALDEQRTELEGLQMRQAEKRELIAAKGKELALLAEEHRRLQEHLVKRMQSYYLLGNTGLFNALFSSKSMAELVRANEAFRSLVTYDREVFLRFRKSMEEINGFQQTLAREQEQLGQLIAEADEAKKQLLAAAEEKRLFLQRVQTERSLYEQAIREMNKAQRDLNAILDRMADEERKRLILGFTKSKGKLPPPIVGPLVRGFMESVPDAADSAPFAHGITIGVEEEEEVRAVYGGTVIYADYMAGYGKMVIIEHAEQYYTVTAKFAKIKVGEKTRVEQGDVLGTTDGFATLVGKGLYFEIRHGSVAEDPLKWLQAGVITRPSPTRMEPPKTHPETILDTLGILQEPQGPTAPPGEPGATN